jgi:CheY-like chemotaxis protein
MLILMLEDDADVAACLFVALQRLGHSAVHARSVREAIDLINREPSIAAAVLDVDLGGETDADVAILLTERGIPFLVASAYAGDEIPAAMRGGTHLRKPYLLNELQDALEGCLAN